MTQPPRRWSGSELPKELEAVLSSADADISEQAIERLRTRLSDALGPAFTDAAPPSAAAGPQSAARVLRLLTGGKWIGMGALFALGCAVFLSGRPGAPAGQAEPRASEEAQTGTGAVHGAVPELQQVEPAVADSNRAAHDSQTTVADKDPVVLDPPPTAADDKPAGSRVQPATRADAAPFKSARNKRPTQATELGLAEELQQLEQIRQLLRASPARVLVEADTHARRFPRGTLGPERELLRVEALLRLGRGAEARELADRMLAAPEGHPYRAQLEKLLATR